MLTQAVHRYRPTCIETGDQLRLQFNPDFKVVHLDAPGKFMEGLEGKISAAMKPAMRHLQYNRNDVYDVEVGRPSGAAGEGTAVSGFDAEQTSQRFSAGKVVADAFDELFERNFGTPDSGHIPGAFAPANAFTIIVLNPSKKRMCVCPRSCSCSRCLPAACLHFS
jgi:hypothetical protein